MAVHGIENKGRSLFWRAAPLILVVSLVVGCGHESRDAVISMKGWSLTLDQLRAEYDLVKGEGSFDTAAPEAREAFARTLADKEILVDAAEESEKVLKGSYDRKVRIAREKNLVQDFLVHRRSKFSLAEELLLEQAPLISRAAFVRFAQLRDRESVDAVLAGQTAGTDFEALAKEYGIDPEEYRRTQTDMGVYWMDAVLRVDNLSHPVEFVIETLLADLPEGEMLPPVVTPDGAFLLQLKEYKPIEEADSEVFQGRARQILEHLAYRKDFEGWTDSLKTVYRFKAYPEAYPLILDRIAAFRDSIVDATSRAVAVDYAALGPPIWSFTPEELRQPVYDMNGRTHTVGDFIESLRSVELEGWPYLPEVHNAVLQLENRLILFPIMIEAEKAGFADRPEYKTGVRRITEEAWLDQYFDSVGQTVQPTEEEIDAALERRIERRSASEPIIISALTYPESLKARGEEIRALMQAADSLMWFDLAMKEKASDEKIEFLPPTSPAAVANMDPDDPLLPLYRAVVLLPAGSVSEVFQSKPGSYSVVRVLHRQQDPNQLAFEAREVVARRAHADMLEARIEEILEEGRRSRVVKVDSELMTPQAR